MQKQSILVIDDNLGLIELQKVILEMEGYDVFTAQSGAEAIQVLSKIDEPDLILLDIQLQDMKGSDFLLLLEEKIPKIVKNVPIVFHTAMDQVPKSKATGFIRKATRIDKYLESVRNFIEIGRPVFQH